jgi:hypothetical protein
MLLMIAMALATTAADEVAIRAARARSNGAIAAHAYSGVEAELAPGYTVIPGSLGRPLEAEAAAARIGAGMRDPSFVTYLRTPRRIAIASNRKRAVELGKWVGIWKKADGEMRLTGTYQATWVPVGTAWKLLNESFVSLDCVGSKECAEVY